MPNCDFFAACEDHRTILNWVFSLGDCDVYELSSGLDQPLKRLATMSEVEEHFAISSWAERSREALHFQIHPRSAGGRVQIERVELRPDKCQGATFRYTCSGWGLVQLYLQSVDRHNCLKNSHTNHMSEKRAAGWESQVPELGPVAAWDFQEVARWSRRLNTFIRNQQASKIASRVILPGAKVLQDSGIQLG